MKKGTGNQMAILDITIILKLDGLVKSRHSGENRSPESL